MNISCEKAGHAGCILLRALEPVVGLEKMARNRGLEKGASPRNLTGGPSRLCQAMGLTRLKHNGLDLLDPDSPLQMYDDGVIFESLLVTPRIGIRHAVELPLRFAVMEHACVSGPRKINDRRIFVGRDTVTLKRSSPKPGPFQNH